MSNSTDERRTHERGIQPAPKRIIICCDGTWQSSVSSKTNVPSNVTRIARYLAKAGCDADEKEWQQLVYYDPGIGTGLNKFEDVREGATGLGFDENIIEAYNFIVLNFNPGDQIFCFGFSRGAYTARSVAGLVTDIGIIQPRDMQDFPQLFRLYKNHTESHGFRASKAWRDWLEGECNVQGDRNATKHSTSIHAAAPDSTRWVEAVGVFDTVGALGVPYVKGPIGSLLHFIGQWLPASDVGFHNVALSPFIKNAYHALALDEHRKSFVPTMWYLPSDQTSDQAQAQHPSSHYQKIWEELRGKPDASEADLSKAWEDLMTAQTHEELSGHASNLLQVWFPGAHINTGGGDSDLLQIDTKSSDFEQMSMLTLTWMIDQLKKHLSFETDLASTFAMDRIRLIQPIIQKVISGRVQCHWLSQRISTSLAKLSETSPQATSHRNTQAEAIAREILHEWAIGPISDEIRGLTRRGGSTYRSPGNYQNDRILDKSGAQRGVTNEFIHPAVYHRMKSLPTAYKPQPLLGFTRQAVSDHDGKPIYQWTKGDVTIPEWKITNVDNLERACIVNEAAKIFLAELDQYYDTR